MSARAAINACALFGIRENSVRVALVRLGATGIIEAAGRGTYRLGPKAAQLANDVASWRDIEQRVCDWHGGPSPTTSSAGLRAAAAGTTT